MLDNNNDQDAGFSVDLSAIESAAAELDRAAANAPPEKKVKRVRKAAATADNPEVIKKESGSEPPKEVFTPDPHFQMMLTHGVSQGFDFMITRYGYMEPGDTTREAVGGAIARMFQRITPVEPGPWADGMVILGYVGLWILIGRRKKELTT